MTLMSEGSQTPRVIPWHNAPGIPVAQVLVGDDGLIPGELMAGGGLYDAVKRTTDSMPAGSLAVFNQWIHNPAVGALDPVNAAMRILLGSRLALVADSLRVSDQYRGTASMNWAGVYDNSGYMKQNGITLFTQAVPIVHEYGHHVDCRYKELVLDASPANGTNWLTASPPFSTLAEASIPGIPDGVYAKTNSLEWFAETWAALLTGNNNNGTNMTDADFISHCAGGDATRAAAIKTAFYALFPGLFPTFPITQPTSTSPTILRLFTVRDGNGTGNLTPAVPAYMYFDDATTDTTAQAHLSASDTSFIYTFLSVAATGNEGNDLTVTWQRSDNGVTWVDWMAMGAIWGGELSFMNSPDRTKPFVRAKITNGAGTAYSGLYTLQTITPPTFTTQPAGGDLSVATGAATTLTAAVSSGATLQWQYSSDGFTWTDLTGEVSGNLVLTAGSGNALNMYQFRCLAIKPGCTRVPSSVTSLYVITSAPTITSNPTSQTFADAASISDSASATGWSSMYWQSSPDNATWTAISGQTDNFLSGTAGTAPFTPGTKYVRAAYVNPVGTTYTSAATYTISAPAVAPVITTQPTGGTFAYAAAIRATAAATGATSQQWQQSANGTTGWTSLSGQTTTTLSGTSGTSPFVTGTLYVRCAFTNAAGTTNSSAVAMIASAPAVAPVITTQPIGGDYAIADTPTLTAAATGATSQKWQSSPDSMTWTDISGATTTSLALTAGTAPAVNGPIYFRCVFTNATGSTNTNAVIVGTKYFTGPGTAYLAINGNTGLVPQLPSAVSALTFACPPAYGYPALTYQWKSGTSSSSGTMTSITGATSQTLSATFGTTPYVRNRYFRCVVSNSVGTATSSYVKLQDGYYATLITHLDATPHTYTLASATTYTTSVTYTDGDPSGTVSWAYIKNGDGATYTVIAGQTSATLSVVLSAANGYSAGSYVFYAVVTNTFGAMGSNPSGAVTLT